GAPSPLEGERVEVKHHDAPAEGAVGDVHLASRFVQANLFNLADDHRRAGRILLEERRRGGRGRLLRGRVGPTPAATTLLRERADRTGGAAAGLTGRRLFIAVSASATL